MQCTMTSRKFKPTVKASVTAVILVGFMVGLAVWQLQRLQWKTDLLAEMDAHMAAPPVPMPETLGDKKDWEYRRVTLAGAYDYAHEFLIQPRTLDGRIGYHMVVPFKRASGGTVLVNRGWIADEFLKSADRPRGIQQIEGILQYPEKSTFTPDNMPAKNGWFWIDTNALGTAAGVTGVAPAVVVIANKTPGVYPTGGKLRIEIPNDHKQYAIFWFSMAAVLAFIWFLSQWRLVDEAPFDEKKNASL